MPQTAGLALLAYSFDCVSDSSVEPSPGSEPQVPSSKLQAANSRLRGTGESLIPPRSEYGYCCAPLRILLHHPSP
ncbi:hypothetical protein BDW60DRAFT_175538 [Aspergillus nidulans var. acristatus]